VRTAAVLLARAVAADDDDIAAALWQQAHVRTTIEFAASQGVVGLLATTAHRLGAADALAEAAQRSARAVAFGQLTLLAAHRSLTAALDAAGIAVMTLKGPVLQVREWGADVRPYADLDLLVRARDLAEALDVVERLGGAIVDRNWRLLLDDGASEVHCSVLDGIPVDLHWHPVNHARTRDRFRVSVSELFDRAVPVTLPTGTTCALDPVDALLHVALHAAVSGGHRLQWLVDIRRSAASPGIDWDTLRARAAHARIGLPVACMLGRAAATVGTAAPVELPVSLVTRVQRPLLRPMSAWSPDGHLPGGGSLGRVSARSLRDTAPASAVAAWGAGTLMLRRVVERHEYWLDPDDPRHPSCRRGGDAIRRAFLESVVADELRGSNATPREQRVAMRPFALQTR